MFCKIYLNFALLWGLSLFNLYAQNAVVSLNGGINMIVNSGTKIKANNMDFQLYNGVLQNNGSIENEGNFNIYAVSTINGNGDYILSGNWQNLGTSLGLPSLEFKGSTNSTLKSGYFPINNLRLSKNKAKLTIQDSCNIANQINFLKDSNYVELNNISLSLNNNATILNADKDNYIITNGTGHVFKKGIVSSSTFLYPIGYNSTTYNPITLIQGTNATTDEIGVRCLEKVYNNGLTGSSLSSGVVDASWNLKEKISGGNNLTLIPQWNANDELPGFDANKCGVSKNIGTNQWDLLFANAAAKLGNNPYTQQRNLINNLGVFAVGSKELANVVQISPKVFLQGAFSGTMMDDAIRYLIPNQENITTRPAQFTHIGWSGNEIATVLNNQTNNANNIVDWIYLELRSATDPSIVKFTRSCLLQRDGDVVDENGSTSIKLYGVPNDAYYICVRHRNHLGFRTAAPITLNFNTIALNFTNSSIALFGSSPTFTVVANVQAMNSGDSNSDGSIDAFDTIIWEAQNGLFDDYTLNSDYNMDGSVDALDSILWELNNGKFEEIN